MQDRLKTTSLGNSAEVSTIVSKGEPEEPQEEQAPVAESEDKDQPKDKPKADDPFHGTGNVIEQWDADVLRNTHVQQEEERARREKAARGH